MQATNPQLQQLGEHLRRWRILNHNTQERVAASAGISVATLNKLEHGRGGSLNAFIEVCLVLGIADTLIDALDPHNTDLGRARAHLWNRQRARPVGVVPHSTGAGSRIP